jgi:uncharacterized protein YjbI with pentapeptide repeats
MSHTAYDQRIVQDYKKGERNFQNRDLSGVSLNHAELSMINLSGCNLSAVCGEEKKLSANYKGFEHTILVSANLSQTICIGTNFLQADVTDADCRNADLTRANFRQATLQNADFRGSILIDTNFADADFPLSLPPRLDNQTRLLPKECDVWDFKPTVHDVYTTQARFAGLEKAQFHAITRQLGPMQRSALNKIMRMACQNIIHVAGAAETKAFSATGDEVDFETLRQTSVIDSIHYLSGDHQGHDFTNHDTKALQGGVIDRANLSGAVLAGVNLQDAIFSHVDLSGADLTGANLTGVVFVNCLLDGVKLDGATLDDTRLVRLRTH